jgi:hypothetical protein
MKENNKGRAKKTAVILVARPIPVKIEPSKMYYGFVD